MSSDDSEIGRFGEDENSSSDDSESTVGSSNCVKLQLPDHLRAYFKKIDLNRDVEKIDCDMSLLEKVISNYIVVKKILSFLSWQDKLMCKLVNTTWHSAVQSLQREQFGPEDFGLSYSSKKIVSYRKSHTFYTEPLAVLAFANIDVVNLSAKCESLHPHPCDPPCDRSHSLMEFIFQDSCAPKDVMLTVRANYVSFVPLPLSPTYIQMIKHVSVYPNPFIGGVYIPKIPDVEYHIINIKSQNNMKKEFYDMVDKIAQTRIFKGILVYVSEKYLLHSVESIVFLNYFKKVQPDIPYALGGCIVEDTLSEQSNFTELIHCLNNDKDFISENLISLGIFTVPKVYSPEGSGDKENFDMYSVVVQSSDWTKAKIQQTISEFSKAVPRYEHSLVLKLSCVGREQKHSLEQDSFRAEFPDTRLLGCYGNGELGINHPSEAAAQGPPVKRHRLDPGPQFGIMFSYSTVFVYMGWGKKMMHT